MAFTFRVDTDELIGERASQRIGLGVRPKALEELRGRIGEMWLDGPGGWVWPHGPPSNPFLRRYAQRISWKQYRRTATLIRRKRRFGQRAWLVNLDGSRLSPQKAGTVRTTVTERVMERLTESPPD